MSRGSRGYRRGRSSASSSSGRRGNRWGTRSRSSSSTPRRSGLGTGFSPASVRSSRGLSAGFSPASNRSSRPASRASARFTQNGRSYAASQASVASPSPLGVAHGRPAAQLSPGEEPSRSDVDVDAMQEVIVALDIRDSLMGCAFFSTATGRLLVSNDVSMANLDTAEQFIIHTQPTTLLICMRAPEHLKDFLEKRSHPITEGEEEPRFILRALSSAEFSNQAALERLIGLSDKLTTNIQAVFNISGHDRHSNGLDGLAEGSLPRESHSIKLMRLASLINLESQVSVNCAGAVLGETHRRCSMGCLPDGQSAQELFGVATVEMFTLSDCMFVNSETLLSLQIVQSELHPNSQSLGRDPNGGGAKESLSVYGLFHQQACTPQGRNQLQQLVLRPTLNLDIIAERQRTISLLLRTENVESVGQLTPTLRKIRNIRTAIVQLQKGAGSSSSGRSFDRSIWGSLMHFAAQTLKLREAVQTLSTTNGTEIMRKLLDCIQPPVLVAVGDMISRTIDFEQSKARGRTSVNSGVDPQLDELKRRYDGMTSFLTEVVNSLNQRIPEWACQYIKSCVFLPQIGFLMVVELDPETGNGKYEGEGANDDRWEKIFTADGTACYKNRYMKDLDDQYGDMYCEIGDREVEIIHDLAIRILEHEESLSLISDLCGEFDALLALALTAKKYGWKPPNMTTENVLKIKGGRHPLQELVVPSFVPNDCYLSGGIDAPEASGREEPEALVLTGPNHSGKSIYLKQTAIIVYLAHIGSFVPAEQATIGLTDKILTRISTQESVSRTESAFAIDLRQVAQAIKCSTSRSLVLVDEFGKGTNVHDGAGLLAALLDHFLSLGERMPRLLLATHFHEVLEGGYLSDYAALRLGHLVVRTDWEAGRAEDQFTYLFKLAEGPSYSSFGARCAALNGVPSAVVERAEAIGLLLSRNEDLTSACARLSQDEERRLEIAEATARRFLEGDLSQGGGAGAVEVAKDLLNRSLAT